jgi:hypothetical protein
MFIFYSTCTDQCIPNKCKENHEIDKSSISYLLNISIKISLYIFWIIVFAYLIASSITLPTELIVLLINLNYLKVFVLLLAIILGMISIIFSLYVKPKCSEGHIIDHCEKGYKHQDEGKFLKFVRLFLLILAFIFIFFLNFCFDWNNLSK